jgi:hypothetical protein
LHDSFLIRWALRTTFNDLTSLNQPGIVSVIAVIGKFNTGIRYQIQIAWENYVQDISGSDLRTRYQNRNGKTVTVTALASKTSSLLV